MFLYLSAVINFSLSNNYLRYSFLDSQHFCSCVHIKPKRIIKLHGAQWVSHINNINAWRMMMWICRTCCGKHVCTRGCIQFEA